jgi:hypothetical protein
MNRRWRWTRPLVWSLKYRTSGSVLPYNGQWAKLDAYLAELDRCPRADGKRVKLLVYASAIGDRFWIHYFLPLSVLLAARGADVDFVWSDTPTSPVSSYLTDFLQWSSRFAYSQRPHWRALRLESLPTRGVVNGEVAEWIETLSRLDVSQLVRKETIDDSDPADQGMLAHRLAANKSAWQRFGALLGQTDYDRVLTVNGGLYESAILLLACRATGVPCITTEVSERDNTLHFALNKAVWDLDIDSLWNADAPHKLTPERAQRVAGLRSVRAVPTAANGQVVAFQSVSVQEEARIRAELRLDPSKKLALACTNVVWDSAVLGRGRTHSTMREWIVDTIGWFARRPDWQLVVRTHPHEAVWGSNEPVGQLIRAAFPQLPENVRLVLPSDPVNTYSLLPITALGLVFSTTVGLEMAMDGLTVVTAAHVHYAGRGFTIDPTSGEAYHAELKRLTAPDALTRDRRRAESAMCYFDIYMNQNFRPMPWRWTHLDEDVQRVSISHLASAQCESEYARVYDYLLGLRDEPQ